MDDGSNLMSPMRPKVKAGTPRPKSSMKALCSERVIHPLALPAPLKWVASFCGTSPIHMKWVTTKISAATASAMMGR